jgi:ubiquinone/menaquinone biosynthesis C-methylase UbiE
MTSSSPEATLDGSYAALAAEYYDAKRHPTSANFRWASERLLERLLPHPPGRSLCEVGAGDSALAAWLAKRRHPLTNLLLTDASAAMLAYSERWARDGARLAVAPATALPVSDESLDLIVASLADPYDESAWWSEVSRVLTPSGRVVLTTPAIGWARAFRHGANEPTASARFVRADGKVVDVPSHIREPADERILIADAGLRLVAEDAVRRTELMAPVSHKLDMIAPQDPVVVAYVVAR